MTAAALTPFDWAPPGAHACARCPERFSREQHLALHRARAHAEAALNARERERFERALAEEEAWLAALQKHVRGALNALPWIVLYVLLMLTLTLSDVPLFFALLPAPGAFALVAFFYYLGYTGGDKKKRSPPLTRPPGEAPPEDDDEDAGAG